MMFIILVLTLFWVKLLEPNIVLEQRSDFLLERLGHFGSLEVVRLHAEVPHGAPLSMQIMESSEVVLIARSPFHSLRSLLSVSG